jgi:3-phenylpropionate/cinnamic acid dioxygenase small subunit
MERITAAAFNKPVPAGSQIHDRVSQFYTREAWLLDHHDLRGWAALLAKDLTYRMPLRITEPTSAGGEQISRQNWHYNDDYPSLLARIHRVVGTKSAWSDDPQARFRRMITNIAVGESERPDEHEVMSYILVARNRFESETYQFVTAERHDLLRTVEEGFLIARREVIIDVSVLGAPNMAFFM